MKNKFNFLLVYGVLCALFTYFILNDYLFSFIVLAICTLISFKIIKLAIEDQKKYKLLDEIYKLTSLLNLQMYSSKNLKEGYLSILPYLEYAYQNINSNEIVDYLIEKAGECDFNSFKTYAKSLKIYENEGGNFNQITKISYQNIGDCKSYYSRLKKEKSVKIFDIILLYSLWILVICFLKFSISDYFSLMVNNQIYKYLIFLILVFGYISFQFCLIEFFKNKIRGL